MAKMRDNTSITAEEPHRISRFGFTIKNRGRAVLLAIGMTTLLLAGCGMEASEVSDGEMKLADDEAYFSGGKDYADAESIAAVYRDIYEEADRAGTLGSLETMRRMVARLGEKGYAAVDSANQVDMTQAQQVLAFCRAVERKENAGLTIIVVMDSGFRKFDLETEDGGVNVARGDYRYDKEGVLQNSSTVHYPAAMWQYTEEGYLLFAGSYLSEENLVLTLSDASEHTALRVLPLDEECRALNRKYILPVGYGKNNMFLTDWNEKDFADLNFYDIFDVFYPLLHEQVFPYPADESIGAGTVYQVPEELFENDVAAHFNIDRETLKQKLTYCPEASAYEYRPRGFYETEYPDIPYPEVVDFTENHDGTITLTVNAVYPDGDTSRAYSHKTVVRPLGENRFQYVSNQMISAEEENCFWWHCDRLTEAEWKETYGQNVVPGVPGNGSPESEEMGSKTEQEADRIALGENVSLLTEKDRKDLENLALSAAGQVSELYKNAAIEEAAFYASNISGFTKEQCREVVLRLGEAGFVSAADNVNMENYEEVEAFYADYLNQKDSMVTVFRVNGDGLIGAVTFICRDGRLQTYYIGIGWQEGGIPEIKYTSVGDIAELRLTGKGYLIYAYEDPMYHAGLRQYLRVKPLSDQCRELTKKYIYGLSYVNYNMLVTDWNNDNAEEILMPCMFEDIYRMDTGENISAENGRIPAEEYEKIMTTYFPVSREQVREKCGYDESSGTYPYEMVFGRQYPPFGEVVDYTENADGTITLMVDGVWADYNSDLAFTNTIRIQPFEDGTFRFLSNHIEPKEMAVPESGY